MRPYRIICILTLTFLFSIPQAFAQKAFLTQAEWPDHTKYLPAPIDTDSIAFMNDAYYYLWGKQQRHTPRVTQAALDEVQPLSKAFREAVGFNISADSCPETYQLVEGVRKDARGINIRSKDYYRRVRPFVYYHEPSLVDSTDYYARTGFGYPSGHSTRGWVYAMTLALVVPDSTEAIFRRAQDYSMNRVICGRHYKSDVEASLTEAAAIMTRLLCNEAFLAQLARAREEYKGKIKK